MDHATRRHPPSSSASPAPEGDRQGGRVRLPLSRFVVPRGDPGWPRVSLQGLFVLTILYTLYFARDVLVPIAIAVILHLLLLPVVLRMRRVHVPEAVGAAIVVVILVGGTGWGVSALSAPASEWMRKAPQIVSQLETRLRDFKKPVQEVTRATKEVENLARVGPQGAGQRTVTVRERSLAEFLLSGTTLIAAQVVVIVVLLYFLLASGDTFMRRLVKALSRGRDKRRAVEIVRAVRHDVSVYLGTVTLINAVLGAATTGTMAAIGMPSPVLWGAVAMGLNFIPYVGALTTTAILTVVALLTFDSVGHAVLAPLGFQVLANIESNLVTPYLLGRNLTLNPALVFIAVVIWSWMWGVPGALLAVPFLVTFKIFADHIDSLEGISIFLGRRD